MKLLNKIAVLGMLASAITLEAAPRHDKVEYIQYENTYFKEIEKSIEDFENPKTETKKRLFATTDGLNLPKSLDEFTKIWHNAPISQGNTGTCWSFASTSYLENEVYRLYKKQYKFSEMYTVYNEYLEKAKEFIKTRGKSGFMQGSQNDGPIDIWKKYGCMPREVYTGLKPGQVHYGHEKMFDEMNSYLENVKKNHAWNEDDVLTTLKNIMNDYMGEPPTEFTYNGKKFTPTSFLRDEVKINPDDYVMIISLMQSPYYTKMHYDVVDNWRHKTDNYNVPLDVFMDALKKSVKAGYPVSIGGDVSEAGYLPLKDCAIIPTFDIPSEYIDENARQFRFDNGTTGDDHAINIVGYTEKDGVTWYLIKDSGSGARNGNAKGYYFYHEDYVKLKMINYMIHKDAVKDILSRFK